MIIQTDTGIKIDKKDERKLEKDFGSKPIIKPLFKEPEKPKRRRKGMA